MTATLNLHGGKTLQRRPGGWVLLPDEAGVQVRIDGHEAIVTDQDGGTFRAGIIGEGDAVAKRAKAKAGEGSFYRRRENRIGKGDRWATLNQFVDVIAPHLTGAAVRVWLFMYRHARGGVVELSERQLAKAAGVNKETAGLALRQLVGCGLAWEIFKSAAAGAGSKYGLHPSPASKLAAVEDGGKTDKRTCNRVPKKRKLPGGKSGR